MLDFSVHTSDAYHGDGSSHTLVQAPRSFLLNTPNFCQKASCEEFAAPKVALKLLTMFFLKNYLLFSTQPLCSFQLCSSSDLSQTHASVLGFLLHSGPWESDTWQCLSTGLLHSRLSMLTPFDYSL